MIQNFVKAQLLNDSDWSKFLISRNEVAGDSETFAIPEYLRGLLKQGMKEEKDEVQRIIENEEEPSFENTIVALSKSGSLLSRVTSVLYNLVSAETNDELDNLASEMSPILSEHDNDIMLNKDLFLRVKSVYENPPFLVEDEDKTLLAHTYEAFERSGATLIAEKQARFREITSQLSSETLKFSQNLRKDTNNFILHITDEKELKGIPDIHRKIAAEEATLRNLEGWVFTLQAPSYMAFLMYSDNRVYREQLYKAYNTRCTHNDDNNNFQIVHHIVELRRELAQLLGYSDYATYVLKRRMASNADNVYQLLNKMVDYYYNQAKNEVDEIVARAKESEGTDFDFQPWDFAYYSRILKQELYDYDPDMLRPYFLLSKVVEGVFNLAHRLYGITFERNFDLPIYNKDVECYKVYDKDNGFLAILYMDFFPREGKQGGAWMTEYRQESSSIPTNQEVTTANSVRPVISIVTNFTKPSVDTPSLLTLDEVETLLHEFGHALHGMFAMTHYAALSGTSVYWDFVELPSQFMENYALESDFLKTFAVHYQTQQVIPDEYIERIKKSRNFEVAYACMRQLSFGLLDMAYYTLTDGLSKDIRDFEHSVFEKTRLLPLYPDGCMSAQFSHIMAGGYSAGYYSYKWAEVLDADAFSYFKENGIFSKEIASRFRYEILSQGGTRNPMDLYVQFRGRKPSLEAILKRDGILSNN